MINDTYLVISDLQIPFEAEKALEFCLYIKKHFKVADENVLCVGDEVDQYFGSQFLKDPDALHTPNSELKESVEKLRRWTDAFPVMRVAESNHGQRWAKRAKDAQIPSCMLRKYQEILELPPGWQYRRRWTIPASKKPFNMVHGMEMSGKHAARNAAELSAESVVFGHLHSSAAIAYVSTIDKEVWSMNVGCLIDTEAYAFHYGKNSRFKPNVGTGVVLNGGCTPVWLPYEP